MTKRTFKVGNVISIKDIGVLSGTFFIKAIQNGHTTDIMESELKYYDYLKQIRLKIVELPEVD